MTDTKIDEAVRRALKEASEPSPAMLRQLCLNLALRLGGGTREILCSAEAFFLFLTADKAAAPTLH